MAPVMVCVVDTGMPSAVARNSVSAPPVSAQKPPTGLSLVMRLAHGLDDAPAAEHGAQAHGHVAAEDHPDVGGALSLAATLPGGDQQHPDDADGLLRVVAAVAQAVGAGRNQLQPAEPACPPATAWLARKICDTATIISEPSTKPSSGDRKMNSTVFQMPPAISMPAPALAITAPTMPPISACDELLGMP